MKWEDRKQVEEEEGAGGSEMEAGLACDFPVPFPLEGGSERAREQRFLCFGASP